MSGYVEIISSGILSTIQDKGRFGYQGSGFQVSGCMDSRAFHDANVLVNNSENAAVIEMLYMGISAIFHAHTYIALTGANMNAKLNGQSMATYKTYEVKEGDRLEMGSAVSGRYGYLAIAKGIEVPEVMGSRSTNLKCAIGGLDGRALRVGDRLQISEYNDFFPNLYLKEMDAPEYPDCVKIHVILGPQDDYFTAKGIETFGTGTYKVTDESDRMGYRVDGPVIEAQGSVDILSDGIVFGSIQVPASGKPMVLMADRQTTGGYAKIGTVISADIYKLAQCMPGCEVRFIPIGMDEAEKLNKSEDKSRRRFRRRSGYSKNK